MSDKLAEIIARAFDEGMDDDKTAYMTDVFAHIAAAIRAAGQTRTEYRQLSNGVPLNVSALGNAPYARDRLLARHAWHTERGRTVTTESREVLTLAGEWEPVEVPATAAENGEQRC